jgi:hypothetical protein
LHTIAQLNLAGAHVEAFFAKNIRRFKRAEAPKYALKPQHLLILNPGACKENPMLQAVIAHRLSCTVGLRVFVCENLAFHGEYTPVLAKHSKNFLLEDSLAVGVDRMQRNFGPLKRQVEEWQATQLSEASAKLLIYEAFIQHEQGFPKHLARRVHDLYFGPIHEEFQPRIMWSLSNAFTSAFKELDPIPQYKATARLAGFLQAVRPS